jgi:integrase/recombinase XerD
MTQSTKPISSLRQRMLEDMRLRKLPSKTQTAYVRAVANFTRLLGRSADRADAEDLRRYQLHLVEQGVSSITLNATITGLKFFFDPPLSPPRPPLGLPSDPPFRLLRQPRARPYLGTDPPPPR